MAKNPDLTTTEDEILERKPRHPEATAMILLTTVFLIGAITYDWNQLFGRYLGLAVEDKIALEQGQTPAQAALGMVAQKDVDTDAMKAAIQRAQGNRE
ncbi:MAG: hypothetical protein O6952_02105 [Planctomycetota bacterium]|nr:hypothetical protein [Planctomycetota bacterium]